MAARGARGRRAGRSANREADQNRNCRCARGGAGAVCVSSRETSGLWAPALMKQEINERQTEGEMASDGQPTTHGAERSVCPPSLGPALANASQNHTLSPSAPKPIPDRHPSTHTDTQPSPSKGRHTPRQTSPNTHLPDTRNTHITTNPATLKHKMPPQGLALNSNTMNEAEEGSRSHSHQPWPRLADK